MYATPMLFVSVFTLWSRILSPRGAARTAQEEAWQASERSCADYTSAAFAATPKSGFRGDTRAIAAAGNCEGRAIAGAGSCERRAIAGDTIPNSLWEFRSCPRIAASDGVRKVLTSALRNVCQPPAVTRSPFGPHCRPLFVSYERRLLIARSATPSSPKPAGSGMTGSGPSICMPLIRAVQKLPPTLIVPSTHAV